MKNATYAAQNPQQPPCNVLKKEHSVPVEMFGDVFSGWMEVRAGKGGELQPVM